MKHHPLKTGIVESKTMATPSSWYTIPAKQLRAHGKWWKGSELNAKNTKHLL